MQDKHKRIGTHTHTHARTHTHWRIDGENSSNPLNFLHTIFPKIQLVFTVYKIIKMRFLIKKSFISVELEIHPLLIHMEV